MSPFNKNSRLYRAALLMKSLPRTHSAKVLSRLDAPDLSKLLDHYEVVQDVSPGELKRAFREFRQAFEELGGQPLPTPKPETRNALPENSIDSQFTFFLDLQIEYQIKLLWDEHPKNIAMVLASLPTNASSTILDRLDAETRVSVLRRLCQADDFQPVEIKRLATILKSRAEQLISTQETHAHVVTATKMLSCADPETVDSVLTHLTFEDPDLAKQIQKSVFKFEDVASLSRRDIRVLLASVDTACWAPALKNASLKTQKMIIGNLASRPAELLTEEISLIGPVPHNLAAQARQQVVAKCLELSEAGRISIPKLESQKNRV